MPIKLTLLNDRPFSGPYFHKINKKIITKLKFDIYIYIYIMDLRNLHVWLCFDEHRYDVIRQEL